MDEEIWSDCIKRQQANQLVADTDRLMPLEGLEEEDEEIRQDLSCPFCYKDFDADTLCRHLQDEHCFQANRKQVCPICTARIEKDMLQHITLQHGYMLKSHRRTSHSEGIPSNRKLSFLGKDPHERVHRSSHKRTSNGAGFNSSSATLDPLLSSFVYSMPICEGKKQREQSLSSEEILAKNCTSISSSSVQVITSAESSATLQDLDQTTDELSGQVNFVQHLVLSILLDMDLFSEGTPKTVYCKRYVTKGAKAMNQNLFNFSPDYKRQFGVIDGHGECHRLITIIVYVGITFSLSV